MSVLDCIDGRDVHAVHNGVPLHYTRKRLGRATYTYLHHFDGSAWVADDEPWKSVIVPRFDLVAMFGEPSDKNEEVCCGS